MDDAPEVGLENAALVLDRNPLHEPVNADTRVIDVGVKTAEGVEGCLDDAAMILLPGHIRHAINSTAVSVAGIQILCNLLESLLVSRCQNHPRSARRGQSGSRQADPAGRAGDNDDLFL